MPVQFEYELQSWQVKKTEANMSESHCYKVKILLSQINYSQKYLYFPKKSRH